jgi:uncharacterized protein (DUF433 family)
MGEIDRITQNPAVMGGEAYISGMRVTVGMIVGQIGSGMSVDDLLAAYPYLEREDVLRALRYAAWLARGRARFGMKLLLDMNLTPLWAATLGLRPGEKW